MNSASSIRASGTAKDRPHRCANSFHGERVCRVPDQNDTLRANGVGGAYDRADVAGVAGPVERDPDIVALGPDRRWRGPALFEDSHDHLRIVAPGDGAKHLFRHDQDIRPACKTAGRQCLDSLVALAGLRIDQRANGPAIVHRVDHEFHTLGDEGSGLVAMPLLLQKADILDDRVGEAGDFLHAPACLSSTAHAPPPAIQRL
jgi:hypothetical protein